MKNTFVKTPTVYQMEATECGAASLAMIFSYYGKFIPLEQMRIETGVSRDGCNAANLMRAAKKSGLECHGYRKSTEGLLALTPPCIIYWNYNHFVVYEGIKHGKVYINDPAFGRRAFSVEEIDEAFSGIVLTFKPGSEFKKEKQKRTFMVFAWEKLKKHIGSVLSFVIIGILSAIPGFAIPLALQYTIDALLNGDNSMLINIVAFLICLAIGGACLIYYRDYLLNKLNNKLTLYSAHDFLFHMFRLPTVFFKQRYTGDLCERISSNQSVSSFIAQNVVRTALNVFVAILYLIVMLCISPPLALTGVAGTLINIIATRLCASYLSEYNVKMRQDYGKLAGMLGAGFEIISTLKATGAEKLYVSRILGQHTDTFATDIIRKKSQCNVGIIIKFISDLVTLAIIIYGGFCVATGTFSAGTLTAFTLMYFVFSANANDIVQFLSGVQNAKADMNRVEDIMNYPTDKKFTTVQSAKKIKSKLSGTVEADNLEFGYSLLSDPIIKNFSFKLFPGHSLAITGASGSGKSTIAKIISGLYAPWNGHIKFDEMTHDEIPPSVLTASIAVVNQEITLFSGSIRDNITMWNPSIMEEDMIRAAKDACIHDIITQKPGAYDYRLTEGGNNLSGGQRQRLEIARALASNPSILIMDEATSALDPVTEKLITDNIKRRGCTCIIIAHRLSAIRDCDTVIVMENGSVSICGSPDDLARNNGIFRKLMGDVQEVKSS